MFQEGALFDSMSVYDNVAFPLVNGNVPTTTLPRAVREEVCAKVSEILSRVGLLRAAHKMPAQISGGMRRRVSLARALVQRPKILLLDDPTSGLDPVASSVIMDLIVELHREYRPTTLLVSHDLRRLLPAVERILAMFDGKIVFDGSLKDLATSAPPQVQGFVACRFELDKVRNVLQTETLQP
jgi:phospholipid/cholesterol/gamma-HCH transport system ATP-binding protein